MLEIGAMEFRLTLAVMFSFSFSIVRADEAIFAWTYTTDLLPKGRWEFEQWVTSRWEKEHGTYSVLDFREELEYGLTDDFQIALYLNHHYVNANDDIPAEDPNRRVTVFLEFTRRAGKMFMPDIIPRRHSTAIILSRFRSKRFTAY